MKTRKADRELVNTLKAHVRAAATEMRRSGHVIFRTRFCGSVDDAKALLEKEAKKRKDAIGIAYYSVEQNRELHDTGRVTLRFNGVNEHKDDEVKDVLQKALRRRNLEVRNTENGIRVMGFTGGTLPSKVVEKTAPPKKNHPKKAKKAQPAEIVEAEKPAEAPVLEAASNTAQE